MFIQKATLIGVKQFKGEVEGRSYDTCKVRVLMEVPEGSENEAGLNVTEFNYGLSPNFQILKRHKFPVECDMKMEMELKSGKPVLILRELIIHAKDPKDLIK